MGTIMKQYYKNYKITNIFMFYNIKVQRLNERRNRLKELLTKEINAAEFQKTL